MDIYREQILDHYHNPRGWGKVTQSDTEEQGVNPGCGDEIHIQVEVENGAIKGYHFTGTGCAISLASASMLGERVQEVTIEEALQLSLSDIEESLGATLQPTRSKCALLSLVTLQKALKKLH